MYDLCPKSCCSAISSSLAAEAWPLGQPLPLGFLGAARAQWCSAVFVCAPAPVRRVRGLGLLVHGVRQVQRRSAAPPLAGVSPTRARGSRRGGAAKLHGGKERRRSRVPRGSYSWTADVAGLISCVSMESDVMLRRGGAPPLRSWALGPHGRTRWHFRTSTVGRTPARCGSAGVAEAPPAAAVPTACSAPRRLQQQRAHGIATEAARSEVIATAPPVCLVLGVTPLRSRAHGRLATASNVSSWRSYSCSGKQIHFSKASLQAQSTTRTTYGGGRAGSSSEGEVVVGQVRTHLAIAVRQRSLVVACPIATADVALRPGRTLTVRLVLPQVCSEPLGSS